MRGSNWTHTKGWKGPAANQQLGWNASRSHGMHGTTTYWSWASMIQRCTNPNNKRFADCGGRGITVCERWLKFENFLADMGVRPSGTTLGRINNDTGYSPDNCRWETRQQQYSNTRRTHRIGSRTVAEWTRRLNLSGSTIATRLARGWPVERAVTKKPSDTRTCRNTSGFPNVYKAEDKWVAQIKINDKLVSLGRASTPFAAYMLRVEAARKNNVTLPEGDYFLSAEHQSEVPRKPPASTAERLQQRAG